MTEPDSATAADDSTMTEIQAPVASVGPKTLQDMETGITQLKNGEKQAGGPEKPEGPL